MHLILPVQYTVRKIQENQTEVKEHIRMENIPRRCFLTQALLFVSFIVSFTSISRIQSRFLGVSTAMRVVHINSL